MSLYNSDLAGMGAQVFQILLERLDLVQHHPPLDAPMQRRMFVVGEIHRGALAQHRQNISEDFLVGGQDLLFFRLNSRRGHVRMAGQPGQFPGNPLRR